ncbi:MAG TPA: DUF4836 family protein [Flavitalea sp.]|nr:DUF4836 family protein [Flavitalea sp.]
MKRHRVLLIACTALILTTISCKQANKVGKLVPADASVVIHVNAEALSKKLSWDEIRNTDWFREMYKEGSTDSVAKKLMENPEASGIDSKSDLLFFMKKQGNGGYFAFTGSVKNAGDFEAFNKKLNSQSTVTKANGTSSINFSNGVVSWDEKRFIYLTNAPMANVPGMPKGNGDEQLPSSFPADSLRFFARQLFELDGDNSLGKEDKFSDMLKEEGDMHFYVNSGQLYNSMGGGMMSMMKLNVLFEGNVSTTSIKFEDGKITLKSHQYYGKEMSDLMDKYDSKKIDKAVINRIPSQNVVALFTMNYPPEGLKEFLRLIGVDGVVNGYLGKINYSMEEFIKANKGDLLISFSDFSMSSKSIEIPNPDGGAPFRQTQTVPDIKVLFATSINDKAAFDKLVTTLKKETAEMPQAGIPQITYNINNNWFAASNSPEFVTQFLAGGKTTQPYADKLDGAVYGGFIDLQKLFKGMQTSSADSSSKAVMDASVKMWQDVIFTAGEFNKGKITSDGVVNLVDKNTNSLKQLNRYLDLMAKNINRQRFNASGNADGDTTVVFPK